MIELPAALAPWAAELALLPTDLALALAPWVGRLDVAIGPLSDTRTSMSDEPDGYAGLARRGSYERLVVAEWGVAELHPDEFLRRAAAGEHLFLSLARRGPRAALRSVAIVSCGPAQLGAPRLAHLAALIVLARRAAAAGAGFAWGVRESPARGLYHGLDAKALRLLLDARTAHTAGAADDDAWRAALGDAPDAWCIGARAIAGTSSIAVSERLDPHARVLDVAIERRGRAARLQLELPPPDDCARLFREPFGRGRGARAVARGGHARGVRFASGKLLVEFEGGVFDRWPVPNSPRDGLGKPARFEPPPGHLTAAIGIARKSLLSAVVDPITPTVAEVRHSQHAHPTRIVLPTPVSPSAPIGTCGLVRTAGARDRLALAIAGEIVIAQDFDLTPPEPAKAAAARRAHGRVLASAIAHRELRCAEVHDGRVRVHASTDAPPTVLDVPVTPALTHGFFGRESGGWGVLALPIGIDEWILCLHRPPQIVLRVGGEVVGAGLCGAHPALLVLADNRLAWHWAGGRRLLPSPGGPIVDVAVSIESSDVAWVTEAGEVTVHSTLYDTYLMRVSGGA